MKLNEYLIDVYDLDHSEFESLPNPIKESIREEHNLCIRWFNKCKSSKRLIEVYLESEGYVKVDDGYIYDPIEDKEFADFDYYFDC